VVIMNVARMVGSRKGRGARLDVSKNISRRCGLVMRRNGSILDDFFRKWKSGAL